MIVRNQRKSNACEAWLILIDVVDRVEEANTQPYERVKGLRLMAAIYHRPVQNILPAIMVCFDHKRLQPTLPLADTDKELMIEGLDVEGIFKTCDYCSLLSQ